MLAVAAGVGVVSGVGVGVGGSGVGVGNGVGVGTGVVLCPGEVGVWRGDFVGADVTCTTVGVT